MRALSGPKFSSSSSRMSSTPICIELPTFTVLLNATPRVAACSTTKSMSAPEPVTRSMVPGRGRVRMPANLPA